MFGLLSVNTQPTLCIVKATRWRMLHKAIAIVVCLNRLIVTPLRRTTHRHIIDREGGELYRCYRDAPHTPCTAVGVVFPLMHSSLSQAYSLNDRQLQVMSPIANVGWRPATTSPIRRSVRLILQCCGQQWLVVVLGPQCRRGSRVDAETWTGCRCQQRRDREQSPVTDKKLTVRFINHSWYLL